MDRGYEKPIKEGDVVEVTIEGTGAKGDGIARVNGFVIVVPGGKEGDRVKVKVTRVLRKMAFGEIAGEGSEDSGEESTEEVPMEETVEESAEEPMDESTEDSADEPAEEATEEPATEEATEEASEENQE